MISTGLYVGPFSSSVKPIFQAACQPSRLLAWMGILVILVVGSVQVCHICGLGGENGSHSMSTPEPLASPNNLCPICLSSQPAISTTPVLALTPTIAVTVLASSIPQSFYSSQNLFGLYVRPPPLP